MSKAAIGPYTTKLYVAVYQRRRHSLPDLPSPTHASDKLGGHSESTWQHYSATHSDPPKPKPRIPDGAEKKKSLSLVV